MMNSDFHTVLSEEPCGQVSELPRERTAAGVRGVCAAAVWRDRSSLSRMVITTTRGM